MEFLFVLLILHVGLAAFTVNIAERKGRSVGKWMVFALLFSIIALIVVAIMDDYVPPRERYGHNPHVPNHTDLSSVSPPQGCGS